MGLIAGLSALALTAKTKMVIAGVSAKIIGGVYLYKTRTRDNVSEKKKTTKAAPKDGPTP